jgi:hypothetical protein
LKTSFEDLTPLPELIFILEIKIVINKIISIVFRVFILGRMNKTLSGTHLGAEAAKAAKRLIDVEAKKLKPHRCIAKFLWRSLFGIFFACFSAALDGDALHGTDHRALIA